MSYPRPLEIRPAVPVACRCVNLKTDIMHFLTIAEAQTWCADYVRLSDAGLPARVRSERHYAHGPATPDIAFCRQLEQALQPREACLLWVAEWGVWGSSENLHLYYRLRQSYGDLRRLEDAPAHLFLNYESADLISYLQVGLLCGWDMHVIPAGGYARAFVSHDEYVDFAADDSNPELVTEFAARLTGSRVMSGAPSV